MVVDISKYNGNKTYPERYTDVPAGAVTLITGFPQAKDIDEFLEGLDVVFIAESAYNPYFYTRARELGVKTAVQYNYEFFDWFNLAIPRPDMFIAPSRWHYNDVQRFCDEFNIEHVYLHCPVNRKLLQFREMNTANTFLHIAGRAAAHDRNGTKIVIRASRFLKTDAKIKIHFQGAQGLPHQVTSTFDDYIKLAHEQGNTDKLTIFKTEYPDYQDIYSEGDVLLLPRRYGGNCLPLNEALSIGMPAIMTNISPNNEFLPREWLVSAHKIGEFTPRTLVNIYDVSAEKLAAKIDEFYSTMDMAMHNEIANVLANTISWETMKPKYTQELERLCTL